MFNIGSTELLIIVVVALIFIGPSKLPELMRTFGKGMAEFRRMSSDVKNTFEAEVERAEQKQRQEEAKKELFPDEDKKAAEKPSVAEPEGLVVEMEATESLKAEAPSEMETPKTPAAESTKKA